MGRYVIRRLLQMIPVVIGTTFLIFVMVWALPGDPFAGKCGDRQCPDSYIAQKSAELGLDDPLPVQYVRYMGKLVTGDFGETVSGVSVTERLADAYPTTLKLAAMAIALEIVIGIVAGVVAGVRKGSYIDNLVLVSTLFVISIPVFVIGSLAQFIFGVQLGWFPTSGFDGTVYSLLLPTFVLASLSLAFLARMMRTSLVENLRSDYVRTATAKGLAPSRVIGVHAVRNSLIPVVTLIGADFGGFLGGAIVTEGIFNVNGVGGLIFRSIRTREGAMVTGAVTVLVLVFLLVNLFIDLLYAALDPRIRYD